MGFFRKFTKRKYEESEIAPDEIFLDSENLPHFDTQQFEGRIEKPISKATILVLGISFIVFGGAFLSRLGALQVKEGEAYYNRSLNNSLRKEPLFAYRGVIYDRQGTELAWNSIPKEGEEIPKRTYIDEPGFGLVLGYVGYPKKDKNGYYYEEEYKGKDGVEKQFNDALSGVNGLKLEETDVSGDIISESTINPPNDGKNLDLSIDSRIQKAMYEAIGSLSGPGEYRGGAGAIMDIKTGELIALTSYPEYRSGILSDGEDSAKINEYLTDSRKPFLNRALSGLYTPGSIVKPFIGLAALTEGIISPNTTIWANGSISVPNPYFPDLKTIFKDHGVFGYVDIRKAIAISSDVYFYEIGGGFESQKGLGILNIGKYARLFGIAEKTGVDLPGEIDGTIPSPEWKAKNFKGDQWRVGDTYNTSIGQYGFQVTPLQMARAMGALSSEGTMVTPTILKKEDDKETPTTELAGFDPANYQVIFDGMRKVVTEGTAQALNVPYVKVAGKTGTAQVGISKQNVNSWMVGFFPYDNPRYSFAVLMDYSPKQNTTAASSVMRKVLDFMNENTPEYFS